MIQILNLSGRDIYTVESNTIINKLSTPQSIDEFDINIIDLRDENIWRNNTNNFGKVNCYRDFYNLKIMINQSSNSEIVYVLPSDVTFKYYYNSSTGGFYYSIQLKNMLNDFKQILMGIFPETFYFQLYYENTRTKIADKEIAASFFIEANMNYNLTESIQSKKITSIQYEKSIVTSLNLNTYEEIKNYLTHINLIQEKIDTPQWILDYNFYDDLEKKGEIAKDKDLINEIKAKINLANSILDKNNEYKMILFINGDNLVRVVFEILEDLLDCDLKNFIDEKKEDILIKKESITFIGEIKGVTSNVKSEHVSQLDVHLQGYKDKLLDDEKEEVVKSILIINHQRNTEITRRQPVHENQIKLAERNGSLIIETHTLLKLFEQFKFGKLTSEEFQHKIESETGLLTM